MFELWGYLVWLILAIRLCVYIRWLWGKGYRLGACGAVFLIAGTLAFLICGSFFGSGLE
jgi:hypothetical protein